MGRTESGGWIRARERIREKVGWKSTKNKKGTEMKGMKSCFAFQARMNVHFFGFYFFCLFVLASNKLTPGRVRPHLDSRLQGVRMIWS